MLFLIFTGILSVFAGNNDITSSSITFISNFGFENSSFTNQQEKITNLINDTVIYWNTNYSLKIILDGSTQTNGMEAGLECRYYKIRMSITSIETYKTNILISFNTLESPPFFPPDLFFILSISGRSYSLPVIIDAKPPEIEIIKTSSQIKLGGSAVVIFKVRDDNLKSVWLTDYEGNRFFPLKMGNTDNYASLFAWPVYQKEFGINIIALDKAGNVSSNQIPIESKIIDYKVSYLKIDSSFTGDKINEEALGIKNAPKNRLKQYEMIMKEFQKKIAINVGDITSIPMTNRIDFISFKPFKPLLNAVVTSPYGEHRIFKLNKKNVRDSYHLGMDLASSKNADIFSSNPGTVIFAGYNGSSGNMILIRHGMGLYTLYAHCSILMVKKDDIVSAGQVIARTGHTGYALGDHLHFGVILQGRFVNPSGWMNRQWLKENILDIINIISN